MDVVLDSNVVTRLTRRPRTQRGIQSLDDITERVSARRLRVIVDKEHQLVDEWMKTASPEVVQQLIVRWTDAGGFVVLPVQPKVPNAVKERLHRLRFSDTIDKLIVAIASHTTDRVVTTDDPDFWDPKKTSSLGDEAAPVALLLRTECAIRVWTLRETIARVAVK